MDTSKNCTFESFIRNVGSTIQLLWKRMLVGYAVDALAINVDLPYNQGSRTLQKDSSLACSKSTSATVHYKPAEDRNVQITRPRISKSNAS